MSLKVWLPLTGNTENKGSSPVSPVASGATVSTAGKLGKCYSFDGSDDYISITDSTLYSVIKGGSQPFSIAMWVYHADSTRAILFGDYGLTGAINFNIELTTGHVVRFYWAGNPDYATNVTVAAAGWTHIVICYDGTKLTTYKDGVLANTRAGALAELSKTAGAFYLGRDNRTGTTALNGRLNDFRIYDHALSIAEIKEIAKGLILHYKLDVTNNNLFNNVPKAYSASSYNAYQLQLTENLVADQTYTLQFWDIDVSHTGKDASALGLSVYWGGGSVSLATRNGTSYFTNGHSDYMAITFTPTSSQASGSGATNAWLNIYNSVPSASGTMNMRIGAWKIEKGSVASPFSGTSTEAGAIIEDCSGNGYNATITGAVDMVASARNDCAVHMNNTSTSNKILGPAFPTDTPLTVSLWVKCAKSNQVIFAEYTSDIEFGIYSNLGTYNTKTSKNLFNLDNFVANDWNHIVVTKNGTTYGMYVNGVSRATTSTANYYTHTTDLWLLNRNANTSYAANASISDFRVYATILSAEDIWELYRTNARIDDENLTYALSLDEKGKNLIAKINNAIACKEWRDGVGSYTQSNCSVTLTNDGYRVYRPPNKTVSGDGNTMWGGLKLVNQTSDTVAAYATPRDNCWLLQKTHTYIFAMHVRGQSSNGATFSWTNNMGWGGGGVSPSPTIILNEGIPANFNGEKDCVFVFTVGDELSKKCTSAYSSYVKDTTYLSYRHLTLGWGYTDTGTLGTDVYFTNFRMYDITTAMTDCIKNNGTLNFAGYIEQSKPTKFRKGAELIAPEFVEI